MQGTRLRSNVVRGRASLSALDVLQDEYQLILDAESSEEEVEVVSTTLETEMA